MRQPPGTGDLFEIEVIDADPSAFRAREPWKHREPEPGQAADAGQRRTRIKVLAAFLAASATVVAVVAVWQPWVHPPQWRTFPPPAAAPTTSSHELIADVAGAALADVQVGQDLSRNEPTPLGHVFAEQGGTYEAGAWALFHARTSTAGRVIEPAESAYRVHDAVARVRSSGERTVVTWGPVGGLYWDAETNLLGKDAAVSFANSVGVIDGLSAIDGSHSLGDLQPVGDIKTLANVQVLAAYMSGEPVLSSITPTVLTYESIADEVRFGYIDAMTDALAMASFYFGTGRPAEVHGQPAVVVDGTRLGTLVLWQEGGLLQVIAGTRSDAELLTIANDSVHPASEEEWAHVEQVDAPEVVGGTRQVRFASGTTHLGAEWEATITLGNPTLICVRLGAGDTGTTAGSEASCISSTPLSPSTHTITAPVIGATFVTAVVPSNSRTMLQITDSAGRESLYMPTPIDSTTGAVAAYLPPGSTYELVERRRTGGQFLLDLPASWISDVTIDEVGFVSPIDAGEVYAEPGATLPLRAAATGRSAAWSSFSADSSRVGYRGPDTATGVTVQGAPASVDGISGQTMWISFGPIAGRLYELSTNGLTEMEALHLAESIGVEHGQAVLRDTTALGTMKLVGSYASLGIASDLLGGAFSSSTAVPSTSLDYVTPDSGSLSLTWMDDPDGAVLAMLQLFLGPASEVDHPGQLVADVEDLHVSDGGGAVAVFTAWNADGRLIVVRGSGDITTVLDAARSVHAVGDAEWAPVAAQQSTSVASDPPATIGNRRAADGSVTELIASTDATGHVTVCLIDNVGNGECPTTKGSTTPLLELLQVHGVGFVVAVAPPGAATAELHLTLADGSVDVHVLFEAGRRLRGRTVGVFVPAGMQGAQLVVDGAVVATL